MRNSVWFSVFLILLLPLNSAHSHSTDAVVDSQELKDPLLSLNETKVEREERFKIYQNEDTSIGINENGDPSLNTQF